MTRDGVSMLQVLATDKQKKMFFAICHNLGHDPEEAKERAKKKFKVEHFAELSKYQLNILIELLLTQQAVREKI